MGGKTQVYKAGFDNIKGLKMQSENIMKIIEMLEGTLCLEFWGSFLTVLSSVSRNKDYDRARINLVLSKSKLQRPYITRLITFILLTVPSARPFGR